MSDVLDCFSCLCVCIGGLLCAICDTRPGSYGGLCFCLRCCDCRKRPDQEASFDEADNLDMAYSNPAVQSGPALHTQPTKTGRMNPNFAHTDAMPTGTN